MTPIVHLLTRTSTWDLIATPLQATLLPSGKFLRLCIAESAFELLQLPGPSEDLHWRQRERFIARSDADIAVFSNAEDIRIWMPSAIYRFTASVKRVNAFVLEKEAADALTRSQALQRMSESRCSCCTGPGTVSIEVLFPLGTRVKEVLSRVSERGVEVIYAARLPTGEEIHYEDSIYADHAQCWIPLPHKRVFLEHLEVRDTNTRTDTSTLAERVLWLGEQYTTLELTLRFIRYFPDERVMRRHFGASSVCATITSRLCSAVLASQTPPTKVRMAVLTLLRQLQEDWQAEMCMINNRPRGLLETVSWQAEGAVAQIEEAIVDLLPYLTPKLRKSFEDEWRLITSARQ